MPDGPAKDLLLGQVKQLRIQQQALKPPTLGSQLNSTEARVKKATQRKEKLLSVMEDTRKQIEVNSEELAQATGDFGRGQELVERHTNRSGNWTTARRIQRTRCGGCDLRSVQRIGANTFDFAIEHGSQRDRLTGSQRQGPFAQQLPGQ
eukprot:3504101-Amphidinium_carterae.1